MEVCRRFAELAARADERVKEVDYEFHMKVMELSGNQLLYNIISSYSIIPIANFYGFFKEPSASAEEHQLLCDAIGSQNVREARRRMFAHVDSSRRRLIEHIRETRG